MNRGSGCVVATASWTAAVHCRFCSSYALQRERFDQDCLGQLRADGHSGVADQADNIGLAGDELDDLLFAKTDFAQARRHFRRGAKLFDADFDTGFDAVERTERAVAFVRPTRNRCSLHRASNIANRGASHYPAFAICMSFFARSRTLNQSKNHLVRCQQGQMRQDPLKSRTRD